MSEVETIDINTAWDNFCQGDMNIFKQEPTIKSTIIPKCSDLYISTKTKIAYLNQSINLKDLFWKIPIISYHTPSEGIIKKQMKFNSSTPIELENIHNNLKKSLENTSNYVDEYIIQQIINPDGLIKFKDIRKISIGLNKKDITSYKCKKKVLFYNCFVVILRLKHNNIYKEHSVKVF